MYNVTGSSILVVVRVLDLLLHFIIFIIITIIIIIFVFTITILLLISFFITFIIIRILNKNSLLFLWGKLTVYFFPSFSSCVFTWSTRPFGVDALLRCYHLTSCYYVDIKVRKIGRIADIIWAILCLVVSPVINER